MCGICGAVLRTDSLELIHVVKQLTMVNHRGHEAVGLAALDRSSSFVSRGFVGSGLVRDACNANQPEFRRFSEHFNAQKPHSFIGHVRYSTVGASNTHNAQPIRMHHPIFGEFYLAHNGQVPNHHVIRKDLEKNGARFSTESDSETLAVIIAQSTHATLSLAVAQVLHKVPGAYSLLVLGKEELVAARDQHGFWPLWMGKSQNGNIYFSSEAGALGELPSITRLKPGQMITVDFQKGFEAQSTSCASASHHRCWLDVAYLARPDERIGETVIAKARYALGETLAKLSPVDADIVVGVPDSGFDAAQGFAAHSGLLLEPRAMVRQRYVPGRSFIFPNQSDRDEIAIDKHSITKSLVASKRVVAVDDSLVRSTTSSSITKRMRAAGATEIHWRIAAPPITHRCGYGIDIPTQNELAACGRSPQEIADMIGADSLAFLPVKEFEGTLNEFNSGWCKGCTSGVYPIPL